ncbi:MAG: adenylate/guanylate cyclase domain-containing protein [Acidimicrobiales bacterium]
MGERVRYARSGDVSIAYVDFPGGPASVVYVDGFTTNVGISGAYETWLPDVSRFARVVNLDKRGVGLSERSVGIADLETRMDDLRAVMDAVGLDRAHLLGVSEGGPMSILFAATYPERVESLTLVGTFARFTRGDDHPWMPTLAEHESTTRLIVEHWGSGRVLGAFLPREERTPETIEGLADYEVQSASPRAVEQLMEMNATIDVRAALPTINVPTLVVANKDDQQVPVQCGRYLAEHIPGAQLLELEGTHLTMQPGRRPWMDAFEELVTGERAAPVIDRVLATVLFTDIVSSTELAGERGDAAWRDTLDRHDATARREIAAHRGILVKSTGDGVLARFDGPGRAVACARAIGDDVARLGVRVRAGAHTGEVELRGDDIGGIAVHIASRVAGLAGPGEVLVSRTVKDLTAGSGIAFEDRGEHTLKGVADRWQLYAAVSARS